MTTILAVAKEFEGKRTVWVSSDSRCTCGSEILSVEEEKIVAFPNFVVLFTGLATIGIVIRDLTKDRAFLREEICKMRSPSDAAQFMAVVQNNLKSLLENSPDSSAGGDSRIIIATPEKVYSVDAYLYAYETDYIGDGSGGTWAQSWIEGTYDSMESKDDIFDSMKKAMEIAVSKDTGTGGKLWFVEVTKEKLPPQPKTRKIVKHDK